jgi:glycosyltransferase involved in cell wall biosynthesis
MSDESVKYEVRSTKYERKQVAGGVHGDGIDRASQQAVVRDTPATPLRPSPRVLLISGEYPPAVGGVGDYTATLAAHLGAAGATAAVLTGRAGAGETGEVTGAAGAGAVVRTVPDWGPRGWPAVRAALRAWRPDVVHIQYQAGAFDGRGGPALLPPWLARRGGPPTAVTLHDRHVPYLFPKAGALRARALRLLTRHAAATIATNGDDWAALRADAALAPRLYLLPIGSNIPPLTGATRATARAETRAALGAGPDTIVIAYFGLAGASKGLDTLLDAFATMGGAGAGDLRLLIIGGEASATDGARFGAHGDPASGDLAGAIRARGLAGRVGVTGALPAAAIAAHLAAADLAALPYRDGASWRRGSLLAALAAGLPVVTTDPAPGYDAAGALPALTDGVGAILVPPADPAALAAALGRLAGDAPHRARLAAGALALAARFDWDTIAATHLDLYRALMAVRR